MKNEEQKLYQIGEYVRICRKKGGYSQEELAEGQDDDLQNRKWRKCHEYPAVFSDRQFSGYFGRRSYQTVQKL